jgi:hypothetical protein
LVADRPGQIADTQDAGLTWSQCPRACRYRRCIVRPLEV